MSDHRPIEIAVTAAILAIAANGAAAIIALSATARPEAMGFGLAGLAAAVIGLITTMLWARRGAAPRRPHRVFAPVPPFERDESPEPFPPQRLAAVGRGRSNPVGAPDRQPDPLRAARARGPEPGTEPFARPPAAADGEHVVIYIRDWLAAKR